MNRLAALLLLPLAATAGARDLQNPSEPAPPPRQDPALTMPSPEDVEATLLALGEIDKRLTVPVAVGSSGPYNFIIDTGAERTVIARELAGSLRLGASSPVLVTSMTGRDMVNTVVVPGLSIKSIGELHTIIAPALEARDLGALGLLGIDTLRNHQVTIDFEKGTMAVRPSTKRSTFSKRDRDEIIVTAKSVFGQLIVTDAYYDNTRIQVVLDTGSQVTMGNSALRKRVGRDAPKAQKIVLTSVTGDQTTADYTQVPNILVGPVRFGSMPVAFADVTPFERFGLTRRPALLLGMDALRSFRRVDIDFPNRQVRFLMPKDARPKQVGTGSMLPGVRPAGQIRTY
ncbi:retroviral-like aspartic protease family protein [Sphingomonas sp. HITSZ_GF]|uniref:retroviral-like aspartic protease family protein n=1 Tax=Sphingomonas sp. HITSZ_GF TaxID=3037247 RepID=UPI00240D14EB|nr:retroviral-like aspartic protease family protein [Sphingomonas sp. HITSZ_GF]MDG2533338.1 retroviral-like aspartic protease family protein [Sphingomonas sp. HITSZ_GF]